MSDEFVYRSGLKSRRTFVYIMLALMTASWITGLLWTALGDAGPAKPVTLAVLTLLTLLPLGLGRWLREMAFTPRLRQGILAGVFVFLSLLVVSSGFYNDGGMLSGEWMNRSLSDDVSRDIALNQVTSFFLVALCWWLGLTLGDMRLTSTNLSRYFYVCVIVLTAPSVLFVSDVSQDLSWLYFLFLFTSMVVLGLGRVEEAARRSQHQGSPFTLYWLAQISSFAGLMLGVVGVAHALKLAYGLGLILVVIGPLVTLLAYPLILLGSQADNTFGLDLDATPEGMEALEPGGAGQGGTVSVETVDPSNMQHLCAGLVILVFLIAVALAVVYSVRRWREIARDFEKEEQAAMPSLGERIAEALEERVERFSFNLPGVRRIKRRLAARSIRRIYAALVALGTERGYSRAAATTPFGHLAALRRAFPGCEAQVEQVTDAYVATHYGQTPETREALGEIKAAWEHVRETSLRIAPASFVQSAN